MLPKDHQDQAFVDVLVAGLEKAVTSMIAAPCFFSLNLGFSGIGYVTKAHHSWSPHSRHNRQCSQQVNVHRYM